MPLHQKKISCPWMQSPQVKSIFAALDNQARFVGGCVRDALLDKQVGDIDIATVYNPQQVTGLLEKKDIKVIPTGVKHGTVTAIINDHVFEITTLRRDVECYGRHAKVEFTDSYEEDAARRDFTINAMSCTQDGQVYDYFNGMDDLKKGIIRFVGNAQDRCKEDLLRILRFFRFKAYYGDLSVIDKDGLAACVKLAGKMESLSGERVQKEMYKLLLAPDPVGVLQVMEKKSISKYLFPVKLNLSALASMVALENDLAIDIDPVLRLAILIRVDQLSKNQLDKFMDRWKLSNKDKKRLTFLVIGSFEFSTDLDLSQQRIFIRKYGKDLFVDIVIMHFALVAGSAKICKKLLDSVDKWQIPKFPVTGADMKKLGIKPGKGMGGILNQGEQWWEEGGYKASKSEIIEYIKNNLPDS